MSSRYQRDANIDFSGPKGLGMSEESESKKKNDPWADMLRLAGGAAPVVGAGIGALVGGVPTGGIGALPGAAIGGAIGSGLGGLANQGANMMEEGPQQEEEARLSRERERQARQMAAMQMLSSM